jgi:hypothetical protein
MMYVYNPLHDLGKRGDPQGHMPGRSGIYLSYLNESLYSSLLRKKTHPLKVKRAVGNSGCEGD